MRIADASVSMTSQRSYVEESVERESLRVWVGSSPPAAATGPRHDRPRRAADSVTLSAAAQASAAAETPTARGAEEALEPNLALIKAIVERMTGRKIRLLTMADLQGKPAPPADSAAAPAQPPAARPAPQRSAGFGIAYDYYASHYESETVSFTAQGAVRTKDGREIAFALDLSMHREFFAEESISIRLGDAARSAKDPLVLTFEGTAAELQDTRFAFDLDADGARDDVPLLAPGSGFLALDRDGDGRVNDGRELFGPRTGDGFTELAAHDDDGNGWIDEDDAAFGRLGVWTPAATGPGTLVALAATGVGALHLGALATPFDLRDDRNAQLGRVRASSLYLADSGAVGPLQQVDLIV